MAEGVHFGYDDRDLDDKLDHDGDDDDDEQEVDTNRPFQPGAASTPYHGGEQHEMQTMQYEQSGLPDTSYDETPLLGNFIGPEERQSKVDRAIDFIKKRFPKVELKKLGPIGFSKKGARADIVLFGPKGGKNQIFKKGSSDFLKSFTDKFSKSLGPSAKQVSTKMGDTIQEQCQRLEGSQKQLSDAEALVEEENKETNLLEFLTK